MHCSLRRNCGNKMAAPMVHHPKCRLFSISRPRLNLAKRSWFLFFCFVFFIFLSSIRLNKGGRGGINPTFTEKIDPTEKRSCISLRSYLSRKSSAFQQRWCCIDMLLHADRNMIGLASFESFLRSWSHSEHASSLCHLEKVSKLQNVSVSSLRLLSLGFCCSPKKPTRFQTHRLQRRYWISCWRVFRFPCSFSWQRAWRRPELVQLRTAEHVFGCSHGYWIRPGKKKIKETSKRDQDHTLHS